MSLLNKIFIALVAVVWLGGCSTIEPITYDATPVLGQIEVSPAANRHSQLMRHELSRLLARHPQGSVRFDLSFSIITTESDTQQTMRLSYTLYDQQKGETILTDTLVAHTAIGTVTSLYSSDIAASNAREKLALRLAERLYFKLLSHFTSSAGHS